MIIQREKIKKYMKLNKWRRLKILMVIPNHPLININICNFHGLLLEGLMWVLYQELYMML
jgi:hypothetical protein